MSATPHRLLVTGGAGFIGSNFVRWVLAHHDTQVVVLDKLTYAGNLGNLAGLPPGRFRFERGDVGDAALVASLTAQVDAVIHFAAESHVDRSVSHPLLTVSTNVSGTACVLEAVRQHRRPLVIVSTDEVYGSLTEDQPPSSPTDRLLPTSPYAAAKAAADLLALSWVHSYGIDVRITRGGNTYGPYQHVEKAIPAFVGQLLDGGEALIHGDGEQRRSWLHVDDHCRAVWAVLSNGRTGQVYNVPGSEVRTVNEVATAVASLLGYPGAVRHVEDRAVNDRRYDLDGTELVALGWSPEVSFTDGLASTVAWYLGHQEHWRLSQPRP